jgi:predicted RNase H-like nuclease
MTPTTCIGLDLAWHADRHHSGAVVLQLTDTDAAVVAVGEGLRSLAAVQAFVARHETPRTVVAVDAPLIIRNATGRRPCEAALGAVYARRQAGCHPANLSLYPDASSVALAQWLASRGYRHAPEAGETDMRTMLEVYPHAALVATFDLPVSLKYKRGGVAQKRAGLRELSMLLGRLQVGATPLQGAPLLAALLSRDVETLRGQALKAHEDTLDAVVCAYVAACWARRDTAATTAGTAGGHTEEHPAAHTAASTGGHMSGIDVFGDASSGYIVNPRLTQVAVADDAVGR